MSTDELPGSDQLELACPSALTLPDRNVAFTNLWPRRFGDTDERQLSVTVTDNCGTHEYLRVGDELQLGDLRLRITGLVDDPEEPFPVLCEVRRGPG